jgi:DNA (cytosine-5)-methyltransferase 1
MSAIYNEIEPYPSQWLRNLIVAGHIAPGEVVQRSIAELQPEDVRGATQAHFFAGIGVWSAALRDADWPDDRPVWTGSCPCQPFSDAGRGAGTDDARHLWPEWFRLIRECRPPAIFAEQVASRAGLAWLDAVLADLEGEGYACAAADLPAAGVGAPHKRSRLFFVAYADGEQPGRENLEAVRRSEAQRVANGDCARLEIGREQQAQRQREATERGGEAGELDYRTSYGRHQGDSLGPGRGDRAVPNDSRDRSSDDREAGGVGNAARECSSRGRKRETSRRTTIEPARSGDARDLVYAGGARGGRNTGAIPRAEAQGATEWGDARRLVDVPRSAGATRGFWSDADWLICRDGKARPVEPGTFPLVARTARGVVRNRAAKLKGYGNSIVRQAAAAFIRAAMRAS